MRMSEPRIGVGTAGAQGNLTPKFNTFLYKVPLSKLHSCFFYVRVPKECMFPPHFKCFLRLWGRQCYLYYVDHLQIHPFTGAIHTVRTQHFQKFLHPPPLLYANVRFLLNPHHPSMPHVPICYINLKLWTPWALKYVTVFPFIKYDDLLLMLRDDVALQCYFRIPLVAYCYPIIME